MLPQIRYNTLCNVSERLSFKFQSLMLLKMISCVIACYIGSLHISFAQNTSDIYLPIVANLQTVWMGGSPSPIRFSTTSNVAIAMGNPQTISKLEPVVVAGTVQSGRFLAVSHDAFLADANINVLSNGILLANTARWLDQRQRRTAIITTGHREWVGTGNSSALRSILEQQGFTVTLQSQALTTSLLNSAGLVIIGNAWGAFTGDEIEALRSYINTGGGLLLAGLGWSWNSTTQPYPMAAVGSICGIRWTQESLSDPTNNRNNSPLFPTFYPSTIPLLPPSLDSAMAFIRRTTAENSTGLPALLQTNMDIRSQYTRSLVAIGDMTEDTTTAPSQLSTISTFYQNLFQDFPTLLRRGVRYSPMTQNIMAWAREKMQLSYVNSLAHITKQLSTTQRNQIVTNLGLTGMEARIAQNYGVMTLDNSSLSERQKTVIERYLALTPARLLNVRYVMFQTFMGSYPQDISIFPGYVFQNTAFATASYPLINNFSSDLTETRENQFPTDVEPRFVSIFTSALGHEMTHNIDFTYIRKTPGFQSRLVALREASSTNDMELLRSMVGVAFFKSAPAEYIASIANQWYQDSYHTILLGTSRFDRNFRQPINQALYFADLLSVDTDTTQFFTTTFEGVVTGIRVPLVRDAQRRIIGLTYRDTTLQFTLNSAGDVVAWQRSLRTSVKQKSEAPIFKIIPNPSSEQSIIQYTLNKPQTVKVEIYSIVGQQMLSIPYDVQSEGEHNKTIDLRTLPSGVYTLYLTIGARTESRLLHVFR